MTDERPEVAAWNEFLDGLRAAGDKLTETTTGLDASEQADGFRALLRALHNQLARFEVDRDRPELVPFNGWRQKFFMDNPDFRYWVADINDAGHYVITGNKGDAAFMSVTVYAGTAGGARGAEATARLDADSITFDAAGNFTIALGGDGLALTEGANAVWVRQFHHDVKTDALGWCEIHETTDLPAPPSIEPGRFAHQLKRLGSTMQFVPSVFSAAAKADLEHVNEIRHWSEMVGGAAYTEPGISYLRGGWQLEPGEALVIDGPVVACRYWNVLLHSRFLNSLDHQRRTVARTNATATVTDGRYRFVLCGEDPGNGRFDWLDTEGRAFGIVVMRFLQAQAEPDLPVVTKCRVDELDTWR